MKKSYALTIIFALIFLFLIQLGGTLVESIYIIDLMNTRLDEKALGMFFFLSPLLLFAIPKKVPNWLPWLLFALLFIARVFTPYLNTSGRLVSSGIGAAAALILLPLMVFIRPKGEPQIGSALPAGAGLALGIGLSVLLRTLNFTLDYSNMPEGGWIGWLLGLVLAWMLFQFEWNKEASEQSKTKGVTGALVGILLILNLVYFAFSAPDVIARWTQGNYAAIVLAVSLLSVGWLLLVFYKPDIFKSLSRRVIVTWNLLFALSLVITILAQRVSFPSTPGTPPVFVGNPSWWQFVPLVLMLLLFPVLFADLSLFWHILQEAQPSPARMAPGMVLGGLLFILLIFMNIFSNVWGYIEPVSTVFRNTFWLTFLLSSGGLVLLVSLLRIPQPVVGATQQSGFPWDWAALAAVLFIGTLFGAWMTDRAHPGDVQRSSLLFMTYNIHQANGKEPERVYNGQLNLIRGVSPDVLAMQESDAARISINNNDYVRYYASKLGYYSYYGPTTVAGTFGTAILSKYPLENTQVMFTFSDQDEVGTAIADITVAGRTLHVYNVHPDGSDDAKRAFAQAVLANSAGKSNVVVLGDHNLRDYEEAYKMIDAVMTNAWTSVYPSKISPDGIDMSGKNRIDHIFISRDLSVRNPVYLLPPESYTDHPVHWAEIFWGVR